MMCSLYLSSCKDKKKADDGTVTIRVTADPDNLNPLNGSSAASYMVSEFLYAQINGSEIDGNFKLLPFLTTDLGKVSEISDGEWKGGMRLDYEIRPEARWDNGSPITADDYIFTMKALLNPKTANEMIKSYYYFIGDIVKDSTNPRKFTVFANKKYFKIEEFAGSYLIPEYNFDPKGLMRKFTIRDMNTDEKREKLKGDSTILKFAEEFNSEKYSRDPKFLTGAGPYRVANWVTGQEVVLKRKDTWWGDQFKGMKQFIAHPKTIRFKVVPDASTFVAALKDGEFDAADNIPSKDFKEFEKDDSFKMQFNIQKKDYFIFTYIAVNMRNPKLSDIKVRKALAHMVDRKKINEVVFNNELKTTESFVHPLQNIYNKSIQPFDYNPSLANQLLDEAGWKDTDGDGLRDKVINGVKIPLRIDIKFNANNDSRKNIALIMQEDLKQIGAEYNITAKESSVIAEDIQKLDFEMNINSLTISPRISDPKQIWHTTNTGPGAGNISGWGNQESDKLIDDMIQELDPNKRLEAYMQLQQMTHDDVPFIYLFGNKNRIAIKKKFNVPTTMVQPGYYIGDFKAVDQE